MSVYECTLKIGFEHAKELARSIEPEIEDDDFSSEIKPENNMIEIHICASSLSRLRAAVNSFLRLIRVCEGV